MRSTGNLSRVSYRLLLWEKLRKILCVSKFCNSVDVDTVFVPELTSLTGWVSVASPSFVFKVSGRRLGVLLLSPSSAKVLRVGKLVFHNTISKRNTDCWLRQILVVYEVQSHSSVKLYSLGNILMKAFDRPNAFEVCFARSSWMAHP